MRQDPPPASSFSNQPSHHSSMESLVEDKITRFGNPPTRCSTEVRTVTPFRNNTPCNPHTGNPLSWVDPLFLSRGQDFPGYTYSPTA